MKKLIISLVMIVTAFANTFAGEENIDQRVIKAFSKEFNKAKDVTWTIEKHLYKATFTHHAKTVSAFYDKTGKLLGVIRYMLSTDLPYQLRSELKDYYSEYWVADLFQLSNQNGISYHAIIKNASETIILSSSDESSWGIFRQFDNQ